MRIIKRNLFSPVTTLNIWFIPTMTYVLQKSLGVINAEKEWYWWVALPLVFSFWLVLNFKITLNKN
jgi:hypothetical protein